MTFFSSGEMAAIQDFVAGVFDTSCIFSRKTRTPDGTGSSTEEWIVISPDDLMIGMVLPTASELANYASRIGDKIAWKLRVPMSMSVQAQDRAVVNGQTLEVQVLLSPRSYEVYHNVLATEIR